MNAEAWRSLLQQWSHDMIIDDDFLVDEVPPEVVDSGWLGYAGASEEQLVAAEHRLGVQLPPSYRTFLQVTNGWRQITSYINQLCSTENVDWFATQHQSLIDLWVENELGVPPVSDKDYLVYGEEVEILAFRPQYLQTALQISERTDDSVYLLNPQIVTADGEWEAWLFANWVPGAFRYRSFWDMMQSEHISFINSRRS
jgi:hypothetical protein